MNLTTAGIGKAGTMKYLLILLLLTSCSKAKDEFETDPPDAESVADYHAVSKRIADDFTIGGYGVITLKPDGQPEHQGEALLWGGTFLWSASCDAGRSVSEAMAAMILANDGQLIRVDPLGEYRNGREITLDGAVGLLLGVSRRVSDCDESETWREPIEKMIEFQNSHSDRLHRNVSSRLVGEFKYIRELIAYRVGLRDEPSEERLRDLEKIIGGWSFAVQLAHTTGQGSDACYRNNLGLSMLSAAETLGKGISSAGRDQFCQNTKGNDIPTLDHWCGRKNISDYLSTYDPTQYEFRFQRCGEPWESADGDGNTSHQLDKLVAYVFAFGWKSMQN